MDEEIVGLVERSTVKAIREIFVTHREMLDDPELAEQVQLRLNRGESAEAAWSRVVEDSAAQQEALHDALLAERAADLRDLGRRVLARLCGVEAPREPEQPYILVMDEVGPSDVARLDAQRVAGILTARGGATSHSAIIARALGIPALVGAGAAVLGLEPGTALLLDGEHGWLQVAPSTEQLQQAAAERDARQQRQARADAQRLEPARTRDGHAVEVCANLGDTAGAARAVELGAEGVGLLRTEFVFMNNARAPDLATQEAEYRRVLDALDGRPLVARTLDVGGDKPLPYWPIPHEENPYLGLRGIRLTLQRPQILETQLTDRHDRPRRPRRGQVGRRLRRTGGRPAGVAAAGRPGSGRAERLGAQHRPGQGRRARTAAGRCARPGPQSPGPGERRRGPGPGGSGGAVMARILTITLNPALDLTVRLRQLELGAVNRSEAVLTQAAGKGLNVAQVLADLGHRLTVSGFLGEENQPPFTAMFQRRGFADAFVRVPGETRSNIKLAERGGRVSDLNGPGPEADERAQAALLERLDRLAGEHELAVVAGSLPRGVEPEWLGELLRRLRRLGLKVAFDSSGAALREGVKAAPWMIKPNVEELADLCSAPMDDLVAQRQAAERLRHDGVGQVVISQGAAGVNWFAAEGAWQARPPAVEVASTVGAGDSLLAGMLHGLASGWPAERVLRQATAIASLAVTQFEFGIGDPQRLARIEAGVVVQPLVEGA